MSKKSKVKITTTGNKNFDELLAERVRLGMMQAPIDKVMEATAEIGRFELEDFSGAPIEYNLKSLPIVDLFIDKHREFLQSYAGKNNVLAIWFGAFIGKVLINEFHGKWLLSTSESEWIENFQFGKVYFDNGIISIPGLNVLKSIEDDQYKIETIVNSICIMSQVQNLGEYMNSENSDN